jgi:polar amino acid transport system permease protein
MVMSSQLGAPGGNPRSTEEDIEAIALRRPWRWISAAIVLVFFAALVQSIATNENIKYPVIAQFLFDWRILNGVWLTIGLTITSMIVSTLIAIVIASMRLSSNPVLSSISWVYVWLFRGTPLLVQVVLWGYLGLLYRNIIIGIPFTDIAFVTLDTNTLIPALVAGFLALTLNQGAYSAEIVRAGMLSVDEGQQEAAYSLGISGLATFRRILLPQAMRVIIPPMGNETISMLKNTSLLSVIAVLELYTQATLIASRNLYQVELLIVISVWYLTLTSILSIPQYYLERRYGRGFSRKLAHTPIQRITVAVKRFQKPVTSHKVESAEVTGP